MPRVKILKSLYELCMECIVNEWDICKTLTSEPDDTLVAINPDYSSNRILFNQLPTVLSEVIIDKLRKIGNDVKLPLMKQHVKFSPKLEYLKLQPFYDDYFYLFPYFEKLKVLDMEMTDIGDDFMKMIGTYCKNLRVLDVGGCPSVTNSGVKWLCDSDSNRGMRANGPGQCKSLYHLNLCSTGVTAKGLVTVIKHLPELKFLNYHENKSLPFQVLVKFVVTAINQKLACTKFSVMMLRISGLFLSSCLRDSLELTMPLCQSVVKIDIVLEKGIKDIDLLCLSKFKKLRELRFCRLKEEEREDIAVTFEGCVVPLLKEMGSSLEYLELECFDVVNISPVIKFCPNLSFLCVNYARDSYLRVLTQDEKNRFRIEWNAEEKLPILKSLRCLHFGFNIPCDLLFWLISFPSLVKLSVVNCDSLTDDIFRATVKRNIFQNLEQLLLIQCDSFSEKGIDALMISSNPILKICFFLCKNIRTKNLDEWHVLARRRNWKMYLSMYDFKTRSFVKYDD